MYECGGSSEMQQDIEIVMSLVKKMTCGLNDSLKFKKSPFFTTRITLIKLRICLNFKKFKEKNLKKVTFFHYLV